jgi:hypothetical protein
MIKRLAGWERLIYGAVLFVSTVPGGVGAVDQAVPQIQD